MINYLLEESSNEYGKGSEPLLNTKGRRWWLNVRRRCLAFEQTDRHGHSLEGCLLLLAPSPLRTCSCSIPASRRHWRQPHPLPCPEPPCSSPLFGGEAEFLALGTPELLLLPLQQQHGLCIMGLADASGPLGLVIWSCSGPCPWAGAIMCLWPPGRREHTGEGEKGVEGDKPLFCLFYIFCLSPPHFLFQGKSGVRD